MTPSADFSDEPAPAQPSKRVPEGGEVKGPAVSASQKAYFDRLYADAMRAYAIAKQARRKGLDPTLEVEIPPAEDLAARVEAQVGPPGVAIRIRQATKEIGNRELVSLRVASEVASDLLKNGEPKEKCLDNAVRTGLSILTEGVLVAPLEGIAEVKLGANSDGTDYVDLWFAGPIRAAGGTGQAMSVLIADVVRRELGIGKFVPTDAEIERYKEEIPAYKQAANLQYTPTGPEIELIAKNCPVCINGEGTEQEEVTGNRDLPRVEGNRLRGGACLVMAEGLVLKAPKLMKHVEKLGLEGWHFLEEFMKKGKKDDDEGPVDPNAIPEIPPITKFVKDIIAGRPVFGHPSRPGAFRLRYGRARTGGLASNALHPATMALVDDFLAVGTQLKVERPGKGTLATPCDELDGPTVLMKNGDVRQLRTLADVKEFRPAVDEILDLGEILIPFGEFAENNALLPQSSWVWEWWLQVHAQVHGIEPDWDFGKTGTLTGEEMVTMAETGAPLHPDCTLLWHDLPPAEVRTLGEWVKAHGRWDGDRLTIANDAECKEHFLTLLCLHKVKDGRLRIEPHLSLPLLRCLGLDLDDGQIVDTPRRKMLYDPCQPDLESRFPTVDLVSRLAGFIVMPRAPCRVGGRMGRPEKADVRKMKPPNHGLFPIGQSGGNQRLLVDAAKRGHVEVNAAERHCTACNAKGQWRLRCDRCDGRTTPAPKPPGVRDFDIPPISIDLRSELQRALGALGMTRPPDVKAVVHVINKEKVPEPLEKAILRAKYQLWTFKDGTIRYDMTDIPVTHFKAKEIHAPVEKLVELGYTHDWKGAPLEREDQICEIRVQDIVVSKGCMDYFLKVAQFIDELLVKFYHLKPYYNAEHRDDLLGAYVIGLAPHTSGGVLSRIIGWTTAQGHYGHPYFHAAKRRNCMPADTEVTVLNSPAPTRRTLADLYDAAPGGQVVDDCGTIAKDLTGVRVYAADPTTGTVTAKAAIRAYKVPAPEHLLRFTLKSGRSLTTSPYHRLEVFEDGLVKRKAVEVGVGDRLSFAGNVPIAEQALPDLDLWNALAKEPIDGVMVRGAAAWLAKGIAEHGLTPLAELAGVSRKGLDQFRRRDSVPEHVARALEARLGPIPMDVGLAVKRDTVVLPRQIPVSELASVIGLYLAEGCARSGAVNQVDFAVSEPPLVQDLLRGLRALGLHPTPQKTRATISGRLVHHLFTNIWGLGSDAATKHLPAWASAAPQPWRARLLRAMFDGDGSVEQGRTPVAYHTISRALSRDVQTQLASFGIASRIRYEERPAGGAVHDHALRTGGSERLYACWSLHVRSTDAATFHEAIGFGLPRKHDALAAALATVGTSRLQRLGDLCADEIVAVEPVPCEGKWLYDLEVEDHHNFLAEDLVLVSNCDGDEDAVMLLMDGLLNFSKRYVPDRRGGLMDLPLVLTTRLDPNEIDKEAHNVDTLSRYPLAFFEATRKHANPKDVSKIMGLVEERVGKPEQYEGFGFTHDTADIAAGPAASAYKVLDSTMEKLTGQMELARKIRAVDEPDVGAKVIGTHLLPDIMGNLKAFSKQKVRCPQCNAKYRRMPLKGVCLQCGNPKITLTVHEGSVRKYLQISKEIANKYNIDAYTKQRIMLLEQGVESLFNNDKVRKAKLDDFF